MAHKNSAFLFVASPYSTQDYLYAVGTLSVPQKHSLELESPPVRGPIILHDGTKICGRFYRHVIHDDLHDRINLTMAGTLPIGLPFYKLLLNIQDYDIWKYTETTCGTAAGQEPCCDVYPCSVAVTVSFHLLMWAYTSWMNG